MDTFEAIGDPTRRAILDLLRAGPMTAGAIAEAFSISRPAISRHLRHLRGAGLVTVEQSGRYWEYRLQFEQLESLRKWLRGFEPMFPESLLDAFETEVYRARRDMRTTRTATNDQEEQTA